MKLSFYLFRAPSYACGVLVTLCLVGCKQPDKDISLDVTPNVVTVSHNVDVFENMVQDFPQDLLYQGIPIHPACIIATQFGDSSRWEPKSVIYVKACEPETSEHNYLLTYDSENKKVKAAWQYSCSYSDSVSNCEEAYQYIGSYKNKHIVLTNHYDTSGTGRFAELGLVARDADMVCNAGEITAGDRAWGGWIEIISLEDNLLCFKQITTPESIDSIMPRPTISDISQELMSISNELPGSPCSFSFWSHFEVNLDDSSLRSNLCGISFLDADNYSYHENEQEECFNTVVLRYIDAGEYILDLVQTESFIKDVWKSMGEKIATNDV